jgi:hypothetical protein
LNNCENAYYEQALMQEIPTYKNALLLPSLMLLRLLFPQIARTTTYKNSSLLPSLMLLRLLFPQITRTTTYKNFLLRLSIM